MKTLFVLDDGGENLTQAITAALSGIDGAELTFISLSNDARECDVAVASPGFRGNAKFKCRALIIPEGAPDCGIDARELVTYGMSPRATLSLSSVRADKCMLEVRREIVTAEGERLEECEIEIPAVSDAERSLAVYGALLVLGILKDKSAYSVARK
jgi:hypothetical protein